MSKAPKIEISKFRIRGYRCGTCKRQTNIFGMDREPKACPMCGAKGDLKKTNDDYVVVNKYVEPFDETKDYELLT
jgi:rRNA maturation endonuclease Nob1